MEEVARLSDSLDIMREGKAVSTGTLSEILGDVNYPSFFGDEAGVVIEGVVEADGEDQGLLGVLFPVR